MRPVRELAQEKRFVVILAFVICATAVFYLQWSLFVRPYSGCPR